MQRDVRIRFMDFLTASAAISSVNNLVSLVRNAASAFKTKGKKEMQQELDGLVQAASDAALKVMDLQATNLQLSGENAELKEKLKRRDEFLFRDNAMWRKRDDGIEDGPYCGACQQGQGKTINLKRITVNGHFVGNLCPICGKYDNYKSPPSHAPVVVTPRQPF